MDGIWNCCSTDANMPSTIVSKWNQGILKHVKYHCVELSTNLPVLQMAHSIIRKKNREWQFDVISRLDDLFQRPLITQKTAVRNCSEDSSLSNRRTGPTALVWDHCPGHMTPTSHVKARELPIKLILMRKGGTAWYQRLDSRISGAIKSKFDRQWTQSTCHEGSGGKARTGVLERAHERKCS
jgi:hypothetical protein